jgi:hypothetical protein
MFHLMKKALMIIACLLFLAVSRWSLAYSVTMTEADLQASVSEYFPLESDTPLYHLQLFRPVVTLNATTNRVGLNLGFSIEVPDRYQARGSAYIDGEIGYNADDGEFYLREPALVSMSADDLPDQYVGMVQDTLNLVARRNLPVVVLYRLDRKNLSEAVLLRTLKSVKVESGKVLVEMDW